MKLVRQYEIKCLMSEKSHSERTILQAVRRSLKGITDRTLLSLGEKVTLKQIFDKLDGIYGSNCTQNRTMQNGPVVLRIYYSVP